MSDEHFDPAVAPLEPHERRQVVAGVIASQERLLDDLTGLTDEQARAASNLPGWSVGHVITHIARNADSFVGIAEAVARGEVFDQYPGGAAQRTGDIEAGASRPAADLVHDIRTTGDRLVASWAALTEDEWATGRGRTMGWGIVPVSYLPLLRWREVEVHRIDLGLGATWHDLDRDYLAAELPRALALLQRAIERADAETSGTEARALIATLFGRRSGPLELPTVF